MGRLYDALDLLMQPHEHITQSPMLEDVPNLDLAYRELNKLANSDGDLGAAYWNSVIKLLSWAEEAHREAASGC